MAWNWEQREWPHFKWNSSRFSRAEERFAHSNGVFLGSVRHLRAEALETLTVESMSEEAVTTSRIEGEILDRASVQSSIRRGLGLATDQRRAKPAEQGVADLMVKLLRDFATPLDEGTLFEWHRMVMRGRTDLADVGRYRTHRTPMRIVSGRLDAPRVHFEAPPSARVATEMTRFIAWFNRTAPTGKEPLPALTRAGIAHLYFESIHPFEDGNGRLGRAISEMALSQALGRPTLTALAATILRRRRQYYEALEAANTRLEISDWLAWFAATCLEAQVSTIALVDHLIDRTRLMDAIRDRLNDRQQKVLLRMFREGAAGFEGGLTAGKYVSMTRASPATATRDLGELVELGALRRTGERRHARYHLPIPARPPHPLSIDADGAIVEK